MNTAQMQKRTIRLPLRTKLIVSYAVLILLPAMVISIVYNSFIYRQSLRTICNAYEKVCQQIQLQMDSLLDQARSAVDVIRSDDSFIGIFRSAQRGMKRQSQDIMDFWELQKVEATLKMCEGVDDCWFAIQGAQASYVMDDTNIIPMEKLLRDERVDEWMAGYKSCLWVEGICVENGIRSIRSDIPVLIAKVYDFSMNNRFLGCVVITFKPGSFFAPIREAQHEEGVYFCYRNREENRVYSVLFGDGNATAQERYDAGVEDKNRYVVISRKLNKAGGEICALLEGDKLTGESMTNRLSFVVICMVLIGACVLIAVNITHGINGRMKKSLHMIREIECGNFEMNVETDRIVDEFTILNEKISKMAMRIRELIDHVYASQRKQKEVEIQLLYEKIQPHFIYHMLDIFRWEALRLQAKPLAELCDSLVSYLRLVLNNGNEMIEVQNEIKMISEYIELANYRYSGAIRFSCHVDENARRIMMPKMILQPIVENAVLHGIMGRKDHRGKIRVSVKSCGDMLIFVVEDDGVGMDEEKLCGLLEERRGGGYGLYNVNERIKAYYGMHSGLRFEGGAGGLRVTVSLEKKRGDGIAC